MSTDADVLDAAAGVTTALARHNRSTDDRLTLVSVRMIYVSLTFFFACFYFALAYLQIVNANNMWKPASLHRPDLAVGLPEMLLIILGALIFFWGQWAGLYQRNVGRLKLALWAALFCGVASLGIHIYELHAPGFSLQAGGYASVFIGLEALFTFVLFITAIVQLGLANRARLGLFTRSGIAVEAFGEFWIWLACLALLNFLALYVQPFFPIE